MQRRHVCLSLAIVSALPVAEAMRPKERIADRLGPLKLDRDVPSQFGEWRIDPGIVPVLPDPSVQQALNALYSQVLARTYVNSLGKRVMLSIAYGSDQSSEATAVHRPEFCYSAQGFRVRDAGVVSMKIADHFLQVQRLIAQQGNRVEPINYWITLVNQAMLPGFGRKLAQLRYGLSGQIADGMLVRASTVGLVPEESFALQSEFFTQLYEAMDPSLRSRFFGNSLEKKA